MAHLFYKILFACSNILHLTDAFKVGIWNQIDRFPVHQDLREAHDRIKTLSLRSRADNTVKTYNSNFKQFCAWCKQFDFCPLPTSDYHVALYLSTLHDKLHSDAKINSIIYGISFAHKLASLPDPCCSNLVKNVKDGLLKSVSKHHNKKEPFSGEDLELIVNRFGNSDSLIDLRFVTLALLSYSGFLRFNEAISLKRNQITFKEAHAELSIVRSKTDQTAKGAKVIISRTKSKACPVLALQKYLITAQIPESSSEFIFRKVSFLRKSGTYKLRQGPHLSYSRAREILLQNLSALGLDKSKFGLHSFRSGGATSASNRGVPDRLIKKHGRWKTDFAKDGYVRENLEAKKSVSLNLGI